LATFIFHLHLFSILLQKHCNKKQETEEYILKLSGYMYHQGTYTPLWGVRCEEFIDGKYWPVLSQIKTERPVW